MVKTKDEIMEEIRAYIGDRSDDQTISLIENISDTIDDYAAHGDYITFLDDDDEFMPKKVEKQLSFMLENDCDLSFSNMVLYLESNHL